MNRLHQIRFADGATGFQEIDSDGDLVALYDADGEQFARIVDADGHGAPSHREWEFVRDLGEMTNSNDFWFLVGLVQ